MITAVLLSTSKWSPPSYNWTSSINIEVITAVLYQHRTDNHLLSTPNWYSPFYYQPRTDARRSTINTELILAVLLSTPNWCSSFYCQPRTDALRSTINTELILAVLLSTPNWYSSFYKWTITINIESIIAVLQIDSYYQHRSDNYYQHRSGNHQPTNRQYLSTPKR